MAKGRPKIEGPKPQKGDVFALYHTGKPKGRRIRITDEVRSDFVTAKTIGGTRETTYISLSTLRPTANGWHLAERDGCEVRAVDTDTKGALVVVLGAKVPS